MREGLAHHPGHLSGKPILIETRHLLLRELVLQNVRTLYVVASYCSNGHLYVLWIPFPKSCGDFQVVWRRLTWSIDVRWQVWE